MTTRKLYLADLAELSGIAVSTLRSYRSRGDARIPDADGVDFDRGHGRPYWHSSTARAWLKSRPGPGRWTDTR